MYLSLAANKTVKENYMCTGLDCILHRAKEGAQWHYLRMSNALYLWRFFSSGSDFCFAVVVVVFVVVSLLLLNFIWSICLVFYRHFK